LLEAYSCNSDDIWDYKNLLPRFLVLHFIYLIILLDIDIILMLLIGVNRRKK
jgi:hypothetical protein